MSARGWLGQIGFFWYVIPIAVVVVLGLATCSLIDVEDFDRFEVVGSVPDRSGTRHAVVGRQKHSDSGATVTCVWLTVGPAPSPGPSARPGEGCVLISGVSYPPVSLSWLPSGKVKAVLPAGAVPIAEAECYFGLAAEPRRACYSALQVEVDVAR